jgi:hypothetical protein
MMRSFSRISRYVSKHSRGILTIPTLSSITRPSFVVRPSIQLQSTRSFSSSTVEALEAKIEKVDQEIIKVNMRIDAVESQIQTESNRSHPDQLTLARLWEKEKDLREKEKDLREEKKFLREKERTLISGRNIIVLRIVGVFDSLFIRISRSLSLQYMDP